VSGVILCDGRGSILVGFVLIKTRTSRKSPMEQYAMAGGVAGFEQSRAV
jgi:hypothetical protein